MKKIYLKMNPNASTYWATKSFSIRLQPLSALSGMRRNFSGGGGVGSIFWRSLNFRTFFRVDQYCKNTLRTLFCRNFCAACKCVKNRLKHCSFGRFLEYFDKKIRIFCARSPRQISYIGAEDTFRNFLRLVSQKWMS